MKTMTTLQKICLAFVLLLGMQVSAQEFKNFAIENAPYACASPGFNDFTAIFDVVSGAFANDNKFVLELSDVNGEFNASTEKLGELAAFAGTGMKINFSFPVPTGKQSYGSDQFKIRVRSTNPAKQVVISAYEYHWYDTSLEPMVLNNRKPLEICPQSSFKLAVTQQGHQSYIWYKDGQEIPGENKYFISVTEAGSYQVKVNLGNCIDLPSYSNAISNTVQVTLKPMPEDIQADSSTDLCGAQDVVLLKAPEARGYQYQWYYKGAVIAGATNPTYEAGNGKGGAYFCKITGNGCTTQSNVIDVKVFSEESVVLTPAGPYEMVAGGNLLLTASGAQSYLWKNANGEVISRQEEASISMPGTYTLSASRGLCNVRIEIVINEKAGGGTDGGGTDGGGTDGGGTDGGGTDTDPPVTPPTPSPKVPKAFTPNGDGVNDTWVLPAAYTDKENVEVVIFSAAGKLMLKTNRYDNLWPTTGSLPATKTPQFYYYVIRVDNKVEKKGTITLVK